MKEGDVLLASLPQSDGMVKNRPVLCLASMPPYRDLLVCGLSTQIQQAVPNFDELLGPAEADYASSGLKAASVIRLGHLAVLPRADFKGRIGSVSKDRLDRLRQKLSDFLRP